MDMFINLMGRIFSQFISSYLVIHFKHLIILFVNYTSVKLRKERNSVFKPFANLNKLWKGNDKWLQISQRERNPDTLYPNDECANQTKPNQNKTPHNKETKTEFALD